MEKRKRSAASRVVKRQFKLWHAICQWNYHTCDKTTATLKKMLFCITLMLLPCSLLFGAGGFIHIPSDSSDKPTSVKKWREDFGYGMRINELFSDGKLLSMTYSICNACHGSLKCGMCYGSGVCGACHGSGMIYAGYYTQGCVMCSGTGKCNICGGSGYCFCTNTDYPGYTYHSGTWFGPDGQVLFTDSGFSSGGGYESPSSSSSSSGSSVCPVCNGRKYESRSYKYATGSAAGWRQPYHNYGGSSCPYCGSSTDHYHYPCSECRGSGRIK